MKRILAGSVTFGILAAGAIIFYQFRMQSADFWESAIRTFEESDRRDPPAPGGIVFTGSSSIRLWKSLEEDMAPLPVLNRGFGGAHLAHVNTYASRIVFLHRPSAVVLYAGDNDLGMLSDKTPEVVLKRVTMHRDGESTVIIENQQPTEFLQAQM